MNDKIKKNKNSSLVSAKKRIAIALVVLVVVVSVVALVWHLIRVSNGNVSHATTTSVPRISSLPGSMHASNQYVKDQNIQNQKKSAAARNSAKSYVPTITRPDFSGSIDDFLQNGTKKSKQKGVCPIKKLVVMYKPNPASCTINNLRLAHGSGVTAEELVCQGCSCPALKLAGYTVGDLKNIGFTAKQLRKCGFTLNQLVAAGFSAKSLKDAGFTAKQLAQAGFTAGQLASAGFSPEEILKKAGYSPAELKAGGIYALVKKDSLAKGCSIEQLRKDHINGMTAKQLRDSGCGLAALKAAGFSASELKDAGFTATQLKAAGFSDADLKDAGFTAAQIKAADLAAKGCSLKELRKDHINGMTAQQLRNNGCGLAALKAAGYSAKELKDAGFSAAELKKAGFSAGELKKAGFSAAQLKSAGFSAKALKDAGFSASQLKAAGFNAGQLAAAGFDAKSLAAAGFTAKQLRKAGFSAADLKAAGFSAQALKAAGFSKGDLLRAGFSPTAAGYNLPKHTESLRNSQLNQDADQGVANTNHVDSAAGAMPSAIGLSPEDRLRRIAQLQQAAMSRQERRDHIAQMQAAMMSQSQQLMTDWSANTAQTMTAAAPVVATDNAGKSNLDSINTGPIYKAGTIMFAVIDTSINSDEKSPILAHIVDGPLKGAKLLGVFTRVNKKLLINFNLLSIPSYSTSISINAVAIDPDTARTSVSGQVDNHYLLRYGTLFASSFLQGIGDSLQGVNATATVTPFSGVQFTRSPPSVLQGSLIGLGVVGSRLSNQIGPIFNTPPTITVQGGTGIGALLMKDLKLPKPLPVTAGQIATGDSSVDSYN